MGTHSAPPTSTPPPSLLISFCSLLPLFRPHFFAAILRLDPSGLSRASVAALRTHLLGGRAPGSAASLSPPSDHSLLRFLLSACGAVGTPRVRCGYRWGGPTPRQLRLLQLRGSSNGSNGGSSNAGGGLAAVSPAAAELASLAVSVAAAAGRESAADENSDGEEGAGAGGYDSWEDPESPLGARKPTLPAARRRNPQQPPRTAAQARAAREAAAAAAAAEQAQPPADPTAAAAAAAAQAAAEAASHAAAEAAAREERERAEQAAAAALGCTWVERAVRCATDTLRPSDALFRGYPSGQKRREWGRRVLGLLGWRDALARRATDNDDAAADSGVGTVTTAAADPWGSSDSDEGESNDEDEGYSGAESDAAGRLEARRLAAQSRRDRAALRGRLNRDNVWDACQARAPLPISTHHHPPPLPAVLTRPPCCRNNLRRC